MVQFFKTSLAGGFFFLLPAVLLYLIFGQIFDLAIALGTPIAPTPTLGTIQIVSRERVQKVEAPKPGALEPFLNWGVGPEKLLNEAQLPAEKG